MANTGDIDLYAGDLNVCPVCGSTEIADDGDVFCCDKAILLFFRCNDCGSQWNESYAYTNTLITKTGRREVSE